MISMLLVSKKFATSHHLLDYLGNDAGDGDGDDSNNYITVNVYAIAISLIELKIKQYRSRFYLKGLSCRWYHTEC